MGRVPLGVSGLFCVKRMPEKVQLNSEKDQSQRMLNALEPDTDMPIHRHRHSSETVVVLRGKEFYQLIIDS